MLGVIVLLLLVWLLVQTSMVQNWLVKRVTQRLSKDLHTTIKIDRVNFKFFNKMSLENALIKDQSNDTLLYAGSLDVRITDWFFLKEKAELQYLGLEDASIFLHRSTSPVWNYEFIMNYFSSPAPSSQKSAINLDLKKIRLKNVRLLKKDEWRGEDQFFNIKALEIDARRIDFRNKKINISDIIIQQPLFSIYNYPGNRPPRIKTNAAVIDTTSANPGGWQIAVANLIIKDGAFKTDTKQERAPYYYFDGQHILFKDIDCAFKDLRLDADTLSGHIKLSTKERCGFEVRSLTADVSWHPKAMSFVNLDILTNKSHLRNAFHMHYDHFDDMDDFIDKIRLEGNFINSEVETDDIAFFAPELADWKKHILLTGKAKGTISDLSAREIVLQAGKNTVLKGDLKITGLPRIDQTFIDFRAKELRTNYADAVAILPQLKRLVTPRLDKIEYLRFSGSFTGFARDFVTYGNIETNLGSIQSDVNMKLPENKLPSYSGTIATKGFNMGVFIDNGQLGKISFTGKVKGSGFHMNDMKTMLDGRVDYIEYNGYPYSNVKVNGTLSRRLFNGSFVAKDTELEASLNGLVDLSSKEPRFDFTATIEKANLQRLKLYKENIDITGQVDFRFTGANIDDFLGTANIHNASVLKNGKRISFDSLSVVSTRQGISKTILINSNEFDARIEGEFSLHELPAAFQTFLNRYYPSYINPPDHQLRNERFSFTLHTRQINDYIDMFHKRLSGLNDISIGGRIDSKENEIALNASLPQFSYNTLSFKNVVLEGRGSLDTLSLNASIADIIVNDSLHFPGTAFSVRSAQDMSFVNINTSANKTLNAASITGQVQTLRDGVRILFSPSHFNLNGKEWLIDKDGELIVSRELITAEGLRLYNGNQEVFVTTQPSTTGGGGNEVKVTLKKISIGDFAPFFVKNNRLEGLLSGNVTIADPFGNMTVTMVGAADQFRLDNDSIGKVLLTPDYISQTGQINLRLQSDNPNYNFNVEGIVNLKDSVSEPINITANFENTSIHLLEKYLGHLFTRIEGKATGKLRIASVGDKLKYLGDVQLKDGGMLVNYTRCYYKIPEANVQFRDEYIDFGSFTILDTLNNKGEVTGGRLYHSNFRELSFDFSMRTNKLLLLNTGPSDNDQFYGTMIGKANLSFTGPLRKMQLTVKGEPADSSNLFLPISNSRESGDADFIVWKVYGKEMQQRFFTNEESNLNISLDINANRFAAVSVILDDLTGDVIKARGNGNIHIDAGTSDEMSMEGRYEIEEGEYTFSFQSIRRLFRLRKGEGNYISWNGDPGRATINIVAEYETPNVRFKDLGISDAQTASVVISNKEVVNYRGNVIVVATLKDRLSAPSISFRIELPANSPLKNDQQALSLLSLIQRDPNELNKQVSFLIVFNTFGPLTSNRGGPGNNIANAAFEGILVNSISGFLSKALTNEFSNVLRTIFRDEGLKVNINASLYNGVNLLDNLTSTNTTTQILLPDRTNFNFSLSKSYFDERLTFVFGSALDFGLSTVQQNQSSFQFLPDVTAQLKLTPDGKFLLSFFYRDSYSYLSGRARNRSGTSISYRKEFDRVRDLFIKKNG